MKEMRERLHHVSRIMHLGYQICPQSRKPSLRLASKTQLSNSDGGMEALAGPIRHKSEAFSQQSLETRLLTGPI